MTNTKITFRDYQPSDFETLNKFVDQFYLEGAGEPGHYNFIFTADEFTKNPAIGKIMVIEKEGMPIGYSIIIYYWSNQHGGYCYIIDELFVAKGFRSGGIGSQFIKYLIAHCANDCTSIHLEVRKANVKAFNLYRKLGLKEENNIFMSYDMRK